MRFLQIRKANVQHLPRSILLAFRQTGGLQVALSDAHGWIAVNTTGANTEGNITALEVMERHRNTLKQSKNSRHVLAS